MNYVAPRSGSLHWDTNAASDEFGLKCEDESKTIQSQAIDCDINVIVKRFGLTGQMPVNVRVPEYGDFTEVGDYRSALEALKAAEDSFMQMPAEVRARFQNDPQEFLEYCADPANRPEMRRLGLLVPEEPKAPAVAEEAKPTK